MKRKKQTGIKAGGSTISLKIAAYAVSIFFAVVILYPLLYIAATSMKDSKKLYELPPRLLPYAANSVTFELDYSRVPEDQLLEAMRQDQILTGFLTIYEMDEDSVFEVRLVGTRDGVPVFQSRAHRGALELQRDAGIYSHATMEPKVLLNPKRWEKASDFLGYQYDPAGIPKGDQFRIKNTGEELASRIQAVFQEKYELHGALTAITSHKNNLLLLESFSYYFQLPSVMYSKNELVSRYSFLIFIMNTALVITWAIVTQVVLCGITAFPISRLLPKKLSGIMLFFFLGSTMIPFISIMIPQFTMFQRLGFYNNYRALLMPFLLPYGFYIYLYKGFFDQLPQSLFDAARIDGAGNWYSFVKICMPLSKPIISLIALQTFLANWNDFFWAWLVTEKQSLWTLNVALYNISKNQFIKMNFIMGLSLLSILPVMLLTIIFSSQIKKSIISSGIKG
ncbi:carbohydrate ABC transporter permease [Hungatella hathewayi]|uniref:carbohydrate ABC transporter permease n=1 Tax=Hungatella hathewayi TaxID=154046 RepID=UPI00033F0A66|nr:carbohydrate ABC transporter permease [Hungatella hathewayi]CCZ61486.1 putative sugar permease [Hungatella hathewayi CAG:224]